jgi:protein-S-isoprenylcysteine O-methyltransferase Ste14
MWNKRSASELRGMTLIEFVVILWGVIFASFFSGAIWDAWGGWWAIPAWLVGFGVAMLPLLLLAGLLDGITLLRRWFTRPDKPDSSHRE